MAGLPWQPAFAQPPGNPHESQSSSFPRPSKKPHGPVSAVTANVADRQPYPNAAQSPRQLQRLSLALRSEACSINGTWHRESQGATFQAGIKHLQFGVVISDPQGCTCWEPRGQSSPGNVKGPDNFLLTLAETQDRWLLPSQMWLSSGCSGDATHPTLPEDSGDGRHCSNGHFQGETAAQAGRLQWGNDAGESVVLSLPELRGPHPNCNPRKLLLMSKHMPVTTHVMCCSTLRPPLMLLCRSKGSLVMF